MKVKPSLDPFVDDAGSFLLVFDLPRCGPRSAISWQELKPAKAA
jgi:hypothetical protein